MQIQRTVIGSFPTPSISVPHEEAVRNVVDLQLKYGINPISDGEQWGKMIEYASQTPGTELTDRGIKFARKIEPADDPDKYWQIQDYKLLKSYLTSKGREDVEIKTTLTGPLTIGFFGAYGSLYEGFGPYEGLKDPNMYKDCVAALEPVAKRIIELGAYLQIDEPFLTYMPPDFASKFLNPLLTSLPRSAKDEKRVSIHVCDQISKSHYDEFIKLDAPVLSIAFSGQEKKNFDVISRESLESCGKTLGVGFISNKEVEDPAIALERLKKVSKIVGPENISFVHPDCGLLLAKPEDVEQILANMETASDSFFESLSQSIA